MHSTAHVTLSARPEHHDQLGVIQMHQHQPQPQQQPQLHQNEPMDQGTMTVLETMDPSQQMSDEQAQKHLHGQNTIELALLDPVQQQQQQHHVRQHLVQQQPPQQPHLHQLEPSHNQASSLDSTSSNQQMNQESAVTQQTAEQQVVQQQQQLRQRTQIDVVPDGQGPILQWLMDHYEIAEGESLPRSLVYNNYLAYCKEIQIASVNAASFGKLIRSVFLGLKTRRLGTRGHSKYHYFGVREKHHIQHQDHMLHQHREAGAGCSRDFPVNSARDENSNSNGSESDSTGNGMDGCGRLSSSSSNNKRNLQTREPTLHSTHNQGLTRLQTTQIYQPADQQQHEHQQRRQHQQQVELSSNGVYYATNNNGSTINGYPNANDNNNNNNETNKEHMISLEQSHCELADFRNHLGANWATLVDEHWPQGDANHLERQLLKATGHSNELVDCLKVFEVKYKSYYKRMVELLSELKFLEVDQLWREFWHPPQMATQPQHQNDHSHWGPITQSNPMVNSSNGANSSGATGSGDQSQQQQQQNDGLTNSSHATTHLNYHQHQQPQQQLLPEPLLTFHQLYQLTSLQVVVERINQIDYHLYEAIESFLLPDMLSPIPRPLAQHIRQFAKNIGLWIELAVEDYSPQFVAEKSKSARAFGSALRRYTSLNHLSTASRAIWEKRSSLAQMSMDLSRVDLRDIEHQVSLMSRNNGDHLAKVGQFLNPSSTDQSGNNSSGSATDTITSHGNLQSSSSSSSKNQQPDARNNQIVGCNNENSLSADHNNHHHHLCALQPGQLIQNFLHLLEDPYPANSWPDWCRNLVESRVCGSSIEEARNFVLKWNFYISLIMKELTLRSAPSFGSFQLIRLLFDEYIFYLVMSRLAQAQRKTPAQLLSL